MAFTTFVDSFNVTTAAAGNTVVRTGYGFQPKVIILWWSNRQESVDTVGAQTIMRGVGFATSTSNRYAICTKDRNAQAATDTATLNAPDACIVSLLQAATNTVDGLMDLQSFDSDGITLVIDDAFGTDIRVHCLALGGTDLTNAIILDAQEAASTGNAAYTGAGFQADAAIFISDGSAAAPPTGGSRDGTLTVGIATGSSASAQYVYSGGGDSGVATIETSSYGKTGECLALWPNGMASIDARATFVSFDSDGFTINWTERAATRHFFTLLLKGGSYAVGNLATRTDGNDIAVTGLGFDPTGILFVSHCQAESTSDTPQTHDIWSMGAAKNTTTRAAHGTQDEHATASGNVECSTAVEFDEVYVHINASDTIEALMDLKSLDSGGFTCVMDDAEASATLVGYLAFGNAAGGGGAVPRGQYLEYYRRHVLEV